MKKLVFLIIVVLFSLQMKSQSSIGINTTYIGAYGLQGEVSFESYFSKRFTIGFKVGSNFKEYSSYKMGIRYGVWHHHRTKVQLGLDLGHLQYQKEGLQTSSGYRTLEFSAGIRQSFSKKIDGLAEFGIMNKEIASQPTPIILRLGLGYTF